MATLSGIHFILSLLKTTLRLITNIKTKHNNIKSNANFLSWIIDWFIKKYPNWIWISYNWWVCEKAKYSKNKVLKCNKY